MLIQKKEVNSHIYLLLSHCYLLHKVIIFRFLFSHNRFVQLLQMGCGLCVGVPCRQTVAVRIASLGKVRPVAYHDIA